MTILTTFNFLPPIIISIIALMTSRMLIRDTSESDSHEFVAIDGIRGFLALFVFIHHAGYWLNYSHDAGWSLAGAIYHSLGHTSVSLFFMLSGFLFGHKLIQGRDRPIDWLKLFCSRLLRLTPLYILLIFTFFLIIAFNSQFTIYTDAASLRSEIIDWILFTIPGHPDVNTHPNSHLIVAGVVWTLPYEWFFYLTLPIIGTIIGTKSLHNHAIWLIISLISVYFFNAWNLNINLLYPFLGGFFAAYAATTPWIKQHFQGRGANWLLLTSLILGYFVIHDLIMNLIILSLSMAFIACGANIFGLLTSRAARALSTISYGIYLLHGITLYIIMTYVVDRKILISLTTDQYWLFVFLITPLLLMIASIAWYWIELPAIKSVSKLTTFLRDLHSNNSPTKQNQIAQIISPIKLTNVTPNAAEKI